MAKQAKCEKCRVRYVWDKEIRLSKPLKACPECGEVLQATTHLLQWPVIKAEPVWWKYQGVRQ